MIYPCCGRMCLDYGLIPHVLSRQELKDLYKDFLGRQTHTTALGKIFVNIIFCLVQANNIEQYAS